MSGEHKNSNRGVEADTPQVGDVDIATSCSFERLLRSGEELEWRQRKALDERVVAWLDWIIPTVMCTWPRSNSDTRGAPTASVSLICTPGWRFS